MTVGLLDRVRVATTLQRTCFLRAISGGTKYRARNDGRMECSFRDRSEGDAP